MKRKRIHAGSICRGLRTAALGAALALPLFGATTKVEAQTATLFGALSNFDVMNDTGQETHGFEIELQGVQLNPNFYYFFTWNRYGTPQVVPFNGGTYIRYVAHWDPATQKYSATTPIATDFTATNGHQCVMGYLNYDTSGCEHFGVSVNSNASNVVYHWLVADPQNPGQLIRFGTPVAIPAPIWTIEQPAQAGQEPVLAAEVVAPEPAESPEVYGDAQWMKVYKTQLNREVALEELLSDDPIVPQDPSKIETSWDIIQDQPVGNGNQNRKRKRNQGGIAAGTRSVIRRYEFYKFNGTYDPITHEALCADGLCSAPADGELGDYIGAQMAAANVGVNGVTVTKIGNGTVTATGAKINCGSACSAALPKDTPITLTANPGNNIFTGWTGACQGTQLTCSLVVNEQLDVGASFSTAFSLSIGRSGKGTVTSNNSAINCGSVCSTKVAEGKSVHLTATPASGQSFVSWTGACSGTSPSCDVTITKSTSVQANFK